MAWAPVWRRKTPTDPLLPLWITRDTAAAIEPAWAVDPCDQNCCDESGCVCPPGFANCVCNTTGGIPATLTLTISGFVDFTIGYQNQLPTPICPSPPGSVRGPFCCARLDSTNELVPEGFLVPWSRCNGSYVCNHVGCIGTNLIYQKVLNPSPAPGQVGTATVSIRNFATPPCHSRVSASITFNDGFHDQSSACDPLCETFGYSVQPYCLNCATLSASWTQKHAATYSGSLGSPPVQCVDVTYAVSP